MKISEIWEAWENLVSFKVLDDKISKDRDLLACGTSWFSWMNHFQYQQTFTRSNLELTVHKSAVNMSVCVCVTQQQCEQGAEAGGVARRLFADSCPPAWKRVHLFRLFLPPHFPLVLYLGSFLVFPAPPPPPPGPAALRASSSLSLQLSSVMLTCCDMLHWNYFMKSILHSQSVTPTSKHTASLHVCVCACVCMCFPNLWASKSKQTTKVDYMTDFCSSFPSLLLFLLSLQRQPWSVSVLLLQGFFCRNAWAVPRRDSLQTTITLLQTPSGCVLMLKLFWCL